MSKFKHPLDALRHHVTGAIERGEATPITEQTPMRCDQCEMLSINGVACHELGCPNFHARWDTDSGAWIKQRECFECGCTVDRDDPCCAGVESDDYDDSGQGE